MKTTVLFILVVVSMGSCTDDFNDDFGINIDPKLSKFVDEFYKQAELRGVKIQKNNLHASIIDLKSYDSDDFIANGLSNKHGIFIDYWFIKERIGNPWNDGYDTLAVEYVVMHELGHHLLARGHSDGFTIMTYNERHLFDYQKGDISKKELIDELFTAVLRPI